METNKPVCAACGKPIAGRTDKRFCDDKCRNAFNHRQKEKEPAVFHTIYSLLKKNRNVLVAALTDEQTDSRSTTQMRLVELGYKFQYCTERVYYDGYEYWFCFDYGYVQKGEKTYEIVNRDMLAIEMEMYAPKNKFKGKIKVIWPPDVPEPEE